MAKIITLVLVSLVAFTVVNAQSSALQRIDRSSFGRNLLDAVQIQMQTGGAIDTLVGMLTDLETQLESDQADADAAHAAATDEYNQTKDRLNQEIDDTNAELNASQQELDTNTELFDEYQGQVDEFTEALSEARSFLQRTKDTRAEQAALYVQRKEEHEAALEAVSLARTKVTQLYSSYDATADQVAFLQTDTKASVFAQIRQHLEGAAKIPKFGAIVKLIQAAQAPERPQWTDSRGSINKLDDLLTKLYNLLQTTLNDYTTSETAAIAAFNTLVGQITSRITVLEGDLEAATTQRDFYQGEVERWQATVDTLTSELADLRSEFAANEKQYADATKAYNEATDNRNEERGIIAEVIDLVKNRLQSVKQYLKDRVDQRV